MGLSKIIPTAERGYCLCACRSSAKPEEIAKPNGLLQSRIYIASQYIVFIEYGFRLTGLTAFAVDGCPRKKESRIALSANKRHCLWTLRAKSTTTL